MKENKLNDYTKDMLREYHFQGIDAATYFVQGDDDEPPSHIEEILNRASDRRVYPIDGGHLWMVPYRVVKGHETFFERKEKAWDHEHCDFCDKTVKIGEESWITGDRDKGMFLFCRQCHTKVKSK